MRGAPVIIPDMVYAEVTENLAKLAVDDVDDVDDVVQWARKHHGQVEIVPTSIFAEVSGTAGDEPAHAVTPLDQSRLAVSTSLPTILATARGVSLKNAISARVGASSRSTWLSKLTGC